MKTNGKDARRAAGEAKRMQGVRAVLFDLDKTLLPRHKAVPLWIAAFLQAHAIEQNDPTDSRRWPTRVVGWLPGRSRDGSVRGRYRAVQRATTRLIGPITNWALGSARLDGQVWRLLDALHHSRIPFGIVTNGMRHKRRGIHALGLDRLTLCIYVSDAFGSDKPDDDIFRAAARCLRTRPHHVLFVGDEAHIVGDEAHKDIWGASRTGMKTAWLRRGRSKRAPAPTGDEDVTISTLDELRALLRLDAG